MGIVIWISVFILASVAQAASANKSKFTPVNNCGTARVISGDTCSNVVVEFGFNGCLHQSPPQITKKISCVGHTITARFQTDVYRYQAEFIKEKNHLGEVSWKPAGEVTQWIAKTRATAAAHASPPANVSPTTNLPPATNTTSATKIKSGRKTPSQIKAITLVVPAPHSPRESGQSPRESPDRDPR